MNFTRTDLTRCQGLISTLNRVKFHLDGAMEAMALSQVIVWVNSLHKAIESEVKEQEEKQQKDTEKALALLAQKEDEEKKAKEAQEKEFKNYLTKKDQPNKRSKK